MLLLRLLALPPDILVWWAVKAADGAALKEATPSAQDAATSAAARQLRIVDDLVIARKKYMGNVRCRRRRRRRKNCYRIFRTAGSRFRYLPRSPFPLIDLPNFARRIPFADSNDKKKYDLLAASVDGSARKMMMDDASPSKFFSCLLLLGW